MRLPDPRIYAVVGVLSLLAAACAGGDSPEPGVGVQAVNTDLGLGLKQKAESSPVGFLPRTTGLDFSDFDNSFGFDEDFDFDFELPPPRLPSECPRPAADVSPAEKATPFSKRYTREEFEKEVQGDHPWFMNLDTETEDGEPFAFEGFTTKTVGGFADNNIGGQDGYRFVDAQGYRIGEKFHSLAIGYSVVTDAGSERPANPAGVLGSTEPQTGLFINQITHVVTTPSEDPTEEPEREIFSFTPRPLIQLVGFPVGAGQEIAATGFDSSASQQNPQNPAPPRDENYEASLTIEAEVIGTEQIEACGERIEAWKIDGRRTFNITGDHDNDDTTPPTRVTEVENYDYWVATQFGSRIVKEQIDFPIDEPTFSQGQFLANTEGPLDD